MSGVGGVDIVGFALVALGVVLGFFLNPLVVLVLFFACFYIVLTAALLDSGTGTLKFLAIAWGICFYLPLVFCAVLRALFF